MDEDACVFCGLERTEKNEDDFLIHTLPQCEHYICKSCSLTRVRRNTPCPACGTVIVNSKLKKTSRDDLYMSRVSDVRARLRYLLCRSASDFPSLAAYNAFLSQHEDWVQILASSHTKEEEEAVREEIQAVEREMEDRLDDFRSRMVERDRRFDQRVEMEEKGRVEVRRQFVEEDEERRRSMIMGRMQDEKVNEHMFSKSRMASLASVLATLPPPPRKMKEDVLFALNEGASTSRHGHAPLTTTTSGGGGSGSGRVMDERQRLIVRRRKGEKKKRFRVYKERAYLEFKYAIGYYDKLVKEMKAHAAKTKA